jgi:outer membrane protein assembly factor BamB
MCPAIGDDGTIYFGSDDNYLYALNSDSTLKWRYQTGDDADSSPTIGSDGTIYFGSADGYLYALNPNGTLKWRYQTGDNVWSSPAIGSDGTIYFGSHDDYLYALNSNGTLKWRYLTGDDVQSSPAICRDGTIYVGSWDGALYAINPNGTFKWKYQTGAEIASSPALGNDCTIYIGSRDYYLYAINSNGTLKWRYQTDDKIISSPAIGNGDTIYVGSCDDYLYALNPGGTLKWRYLTQDDVSSSPVVAGDGTIYVGSDDYYFYAISSTGTLIWRTLGGDDFSASPTLKNGIVYCGNDDGKLYAFDTHTVAELASSSWPKFRHDLKNTGRVGYGAIAVDIPDSIACSQGDTVYIPVNITQAFTDDIYSYEFNMVYPNTQMDPENPYYSTSGTLSSGWLVTVNPTYAANKVRVVAFNTAPLPKQAGTLIYVKFRVKTAATNGVYPVTLENFLFNSGTPAASVSPGSIRIGGITVSGTITYVDYTSVPISNATVTFTGPSTTTTTTNSSGQYTLQLTSGPWTVTPSKSYTKTSGVHSGYDASLIARQAAGISIIPPLTAGQLVLANADKNGQIQGYDAALVARYAACFTTQIGYCSTWVFIPAADTGITTTSTKNFTAGVCGDVDLSGRNAGITKLSVIAADHYFMPYRSHSGNYVVDLYNAEKTDLYGVNFTVAYGAAGFKVTGLQKHAECEVVTRDEVGSLTVVMYAVRPIKTGEKFISLEFEKTGGAPGALAVSNIAINDATGADVSLDPNAVIAKRYELLQNYPNPFNPETTIEYSITAAEMQKVRLSIFSITGQLVRELVGGYQSPGVHRMVWDGKNDSGVQVPTGVYFYRLTAGSFTQTKKMVLIK